MKTRIGSMLLLVSIHVAGCSADDESAAADDHGAASQSERGPHRGRMLRDGAFALELQTFESGVPPEFHVYLYRDDRPIAPTNAKVSVELARLDGSIDRFAFAPSEDYLRGNGVVYEPHSFSVAVNATEGGTSHRWAFDSFEGRTTISTARAEAAGIRAEPAGAATITESLVLTGRLAPNEERVREVSARFPGVIREVAASVGDTVRVQQRLASIESNDSLQTYVVSAPISGVVADRHANAGETTSAEPLFVVADYGSLWAELSLFPRDLGRVKVGQTVALKSVDGDLEAEGRVVRIAPTESGDHRPMTGIHTVRVIVDNSDGRLSPGVFVEGRVQIGQVEVPLAVKRSALQAFRDFTVVFAQVDQTYEVRMLALGRQDDTWVEILDGLKPGTRYVTDNSYLIKADIEKSGATHDH